MQQWTGCIAGALTRVEFATALGERDRGERVAEVVNEIGEQGDAACGEVDRGLAGRGHGKDAQREADRTETRARALDRGIDEPGGMTLFLRMEIFDLL